jgi:hypothetical protein
MDTYVIKRNEELLSLTQEMIDKRLAQVNERLAPIFNISLKIGSFKNGLAEEYKVTLPNTIVNIWTKPKEFCGGEGYLTISINEREVFSKIYSFVGFGFCSKSGGTLLKFDIDVSNSESVMNLYVVSDARDHSRDLDNCCRDAWEHEQNLKYIDSYKKSGSLIELTYDTVKIIFCKNSEIILKENQFVCGNKWEEIIDSL